MKKQSFHIGGYWYHLEWCTATGRAVDQHGRFWTNPARPVSECGYLEAPADTTAPVAAPRATGKPKAIRISLGIQSLAASYAHRERFPARYKATGKHTLAFLDADKTLARISAN
ncbi:hypothetical protein [Flaviaesturariibacter amylovorans]|uniref:Uncharacterized protein n=1 Tax=Flaviaesturariibacter amylovorans TaxID=1084520 RepID=A0ABP8GPL0_9BACT